MVFNQYYLHECEHDYFVLWYNNETDLFELTTYGNIQSNNIAGGLVYAGNNINEVVSATLTKYKEFGEAWLYDCSRMNELINKNLKKIEEIRTEFPSIEINNDSKFIYLNPKDLIVGNQFYVMSSYYNFEIITLTGIISRDKWNGTVYEVLGRNSNGDVDAYNVYIEGNRKWAVDLNTLKYNCLINLIQDISDYQFTLETCVNRYKNYLINLNFLNNLQNGKSS